MASAPDIDAVLLFVGAGAGSGIRELQDKNFLAAVWCGQSVAIKQCHAFI